MDSKNKILVPVHFYEHPYSLSDHHPPNELVIYLQSEFSLVLYCRALFAKVLSIGLSEVPDFLNYQCELVSNPAEWLNSLDNLIRLNVEFFRGRQAEHRHFIFISQINTKRHDLQLSVLINNRSYRLRKVVNGYTEDREYSFNLVKDHLKILSTFDEKIEYLQDQITEYRQDSPDFICCKEKPFDTLCELEIIRIEKKETIRQNAETRKSKKLPEIMNENKIKINGKINYFVDIFFQLRELGILDSTPTEIAQYINRSYVDKNGKEIPISTILTILDPSRVEKRPKEGKRFKLKF
ncbi:MAG: hypothetical protein WCI92_03990 [Bacteroidota bacterium]